MTNFFTGKSYSRVTATLIFTTGQQVVGPAGLKDKILVEYNPLESDDFPSASTCSNTLVIPIKHSTLETFCEKMDKAFELGMAGFGEY